MSLDPEDWDGLRALGHRMLDDMLDHLAHLRDGPVWRPMPGDARDALRGPLPRDGEAPEHTYALFRERVLPFAVGNLHPRFMGWVHGGGTAVGMLAELLAGGLNSNCGGRDHAAIEVERTVVRWTAGLLGMPEDGGGLLVTGTSVANLVAVLVARRAALGPDVRAEGLRAAPLVAYAAEGAHSCVPRALDMAGLGSRALRLLPTDERGRLRVDALARAVAGDRAAGHRPFLVVGTAGSVNTGAVDDLAALASLCAREGLWFHVDGAFGALAALSPRLRPLLAGIERADSVALDFHKWGQVPYDAGLVLVRDRQRQLDAFSQDADYLAREARGLAGGHPWPCDLGPDLSRGFRALKVWMTLRAHGTDRLGAAIEGCCDVAARIAALVEAEPALELLAPVTLNVVCFRVRALDDRGNAALVADLQESGIAAPSTTRVGGRLAIRAAVVNHRSALEDADALVTAVLALAASAVNPPDA